MPNTSLSTSILLLDPYGTLRDNLSEYLRSLSYIVLPCKTAEEACVHLEGAAPGFLFIDSTTSDGEANILLTHLETVGAKTSVIIGATDHVPVRIGGRLVERYGLLMLPALDAVIYHALQTANYTLRVTECVMNGRTVLEERFAAIETHAEGVERQNLKLQREHGELTRASLRHRTAIRDHEAVQQKLARIRSAISSAKDAMLILDQNGAVEYSNPAFDDLFGETDPQDGVYPLDKIFVDGSMSAKVMENVSVLGTFTCEVPLRHQNDGNFPGMIHANEIKSEGSEFGGVLLIISDITEHERLRQEAHFDSLTGLYGRGYFLEMMGNNMSLAGRHGYPLALVLCDLDNFKAVNDTYGHRMGDEVLATFAKVARKEVRHEEIVGRIGGDEFIMLFPQMNATSVASCLERIRAQFEAIEFKTETGECFQCTVTLGAADFPGSQTSNEDFMELADQSLYKAKELGRNCVVVNTELVAEVYTP
jgi:diguanylate cyclase (GGDEF)-like protein/PAS domain S-box-containing protein